MRREVKRITRLETEEEKEITNELDELQKYLEHYTVKYPDERTISRSIEQLRFYVPHKKSLFAQLVETAYCILPIYRFTSIGLFLFGSLLLPNKLY